MKNNTQNHGGRVEYSTPVIYTLDIAVEHGFAISGQLEDAVYDNTWKDED